MANPNWVDGKKGSALAFDGVDDWISVPNSDSINQTGTDGTVTVAAWVKFVEYQQPAAASQFNFVLCRQELGSPHEHFGVGLREGRPTAAVHFFFSTAVNAINVGEWSHLAMTYDGIDLTVYLNGEIESSQSIGWPIAADSTPVTIGAAQNIQTIKEFVSGQVDEVYLYSRSLSVQEVKAVMQAGM